MVGKLNRDLDNIRELEILHLTAHDLWESSKKVALRLENSNFNSIKHWYTLSTVPHSNTKEKVWNNLSLFLVSCSDNEFEKFFNKFVGQQLTLGEFLELLHENNSTGEEIFAFLFNIFPFFKGNRSNSIKNLNVKIKQILKENPNIDLVKIGKYYNSIQGGKGNNFMTYKQWKNILKQF